MFPGSEAGFFPVQGGMMGAGQGRMMGAGQGSMMGAGQSGIIGAGQGSMLGSGTMVGCYSQLRCSSYFPLATASSSSAASQGMPGQMYGDRDSQSNQGDKGQGVFYKTRLCHQFRDGYCANGDECKYAHGEHQLREMQQEGIEIALRLEQRKAQQAMGGRQQPGPGQLPEPPGRQEMQMQVPTRLATARLRMYAQATSVQFHHQSACNTATCNGSAGRILGSRLRGDEVRAEVQAGA